MHVSGGGTTSGRGLRANGDPLWLRLLLIGSAITITGVLIVIPVVYVFVQAFSEGPGAWWSQLTEDADTRHAVLLTLSVAPAAVLANTLFRLSSRRRTVYSADLRFPGLAGAVAEAGRCAGSVCMARSVSGNHVRHSAVCGPGTDSADGIFRCR